MRNLLILAFLVFSITNVLLGQEAILKGKVISSKTAEALAGATILTDKQGGTSTGLNGNYELKMAPGKHQLTVRLISFKEKIIPIVLNPGEITQLDISLDESIHELNLVVISAGKFEQRIEDVTVSMEVLKPSLIQDKNTTSMDDALNQVPGVNVIDGQANIRGGSGWSYGAGSRVQVLVDDLPQLSADANDAKWNFLPVENLEQVEIIKGASSVLFGSSALNGVINVRTAYPREKPLTKINFFTGFYDQAKITLDDTTYRVSTWGSIPPMSSGMNFLHSEKIGRFDLVAGGNIFTDDGYRQGENEQLGRINFNTRYRFKKWEGLSVGLNLNTMVREGTLFFLWKNDTTGAYIPATNTLSDYTTYRLNIDPFITYIDKHGNSHRIRTRWFNTTNQNNTSQNSTGDLYYAEYQFQKHFKDRFTLTTGLVEQHSKVRSELYSDHDGNQMAAYAQLDLSWKPITFSIGGRIEQNKLDSMTDDWTPVFRSGINVHILKETYLRASYGQGYRYPSIAEKFVKTQVGSMYIFPNEELKPEKGYSGEVGVKQGLKIGSWLGYFDAAFFRNEYKNMIEFSFAQWGTTHNPLVDNGFRSFNVGNTRIQGIDLSLIGEGRFIGNIETKIFAGYTYLIPKQLTYDSLYVVKVGIDPLKGIDSSDFLKYRYKHMVKADVEFGYKKFSLGLGMRYNSRMVNMDKIFFYGWFDYAFKPGLGIGHYRQNHSHGDTVFDLRAAWQVSKAFRFQFIIKNVFNYIYMERPADMQPPRTWVMQLGFNF